MHWNGLKVVEELFNWHKERCYSLGCKWNSVMLKNGQKVADDFEQSRASRSCSKLVFSYSLWWWSKGIVLSWSRSSTWETGQATLLLHDIAIVLTRHSKPHPLILHQGQSACSANRKPIVRHDVHDVHVLPSIVIPRHPTAPAQGLNCRVHFYSV